MHVYAHIGARQRSTVILSFALRCLGTFFHWLNCIWRSCKKLILSIKHWKIQKIKAALFLYIVIALLASFFCFLKSTFRSISHKSQLSQIETPEGQRPWCRMVSSGWQKMCSVKICLGHNNYLVVWTWWSYCDKDGNVLFKVSVWKSV